MKRRGFFRALFGGIAGAALWPYHKARAWVDEARIYVNGKPLRNGTLVQVAKNRWHGEIDGTRVKPGDNLAVQFRRVPARDLVTVSYTVEFKGTDT
jgi:hypothetical protein